MIGFILKRILHAIPVLFIVATITFFLIRVAPGGPFSEDKIMPHKDFLRILKEDILSYGTLSDYTLRRIANFKETSVRDIKGLKDDIHYYVGHIEQ